jgi:3-hydroxyacyl-[acyl-carrier-protein] dehydratase
VASNLAGRLVLRVSPIVVDPHVPASTLTEAISLKAPSIMPRAFIIDPDAFDLTATAYTQAQIYERLPQSKEFKLLDRIVHLDHPKGEAIAHLNITHDDWWCEAHIPGRPLLPGVLMLEAAAQLAAFMEKYCLPDFDGFVGYGGVDDCKFRLTVAPPADLWILCKRYDARSRRIICDTQGIVNGQLAFEAQVTGLIV